MAQALFVCFAASKTNHTHSAQLKVTGIEGLDEAREAKLPSTPHYRNTHTHPIVD